MQGFAAFLLAEPAALSHSSLPADICLITYRSGMQARNAQLGGFVLCGMRC